MPSTTTRKNAGENSAAILPRIARADKSAAAQCVDRYGTLIWTLAKQNTATSAEAERAVGEIFQDIWRNAEHCDLSLSEECVWIALIARERLKEYAASESPQTLMPAADEAIAGEPVLISGLSPVVH